jgi:dihydroorotase-like cyclic amidohydrolase
MKLKEKDLWKALMRIGNRTHAILPHMHSDGVCKAGFSLEKVVELSSYNPARVLGPDSREQTISVGSDTEIVLMPF